MAVVVAYLLTPDKPGGVLGLSFALTLFVLWVGYAVGIVVYFSDDIFTDRRSRLRAKRFALTCLLLQIGGTSLFAVSWLGFIVGYSTVLLNLVPVLLIVVPLGWYLYSRMIRLVPN